MRRKKIVLNLTTRTLILRLLILSVVVALPASSAHAARMGNLERQSCIDLGSFGRFTDGESINESGVVVGTSGTKSGVSEAFIFEKGSLALLHELAKYGGSTAGAVNDYEAVAGEILAAHGIWRAYVLSDAHLHLIADPDVISFQPAGINDDVAVVGSAQIRTGVYRAFLWRAGKVQILRSPDGGYSEALGINFGGLVVGGAETSGGIEHAVEWRSGVMTDIGTSFHHSASWADGVNGNGDVVGVSFNRIRRPVAFLFRSGKMKSLGIPMGYSGSFAEGINDVGQVVGFLKAGSRHVAFEWQNNTFRILKDNQGRRMQDAVAINDNGQIVCTARFAIWARAYVVQIPSLRRH